MIGKVAGAVDGGSEDDDGKKNEKREALLLLLLLHADVETRGSALLKEIPFLLLG